MRLNNDTPQRPLSKQICTHAINPLFSNPYHNIIIYYSSFL